jgi:hypothetical protein
VWRGNAVEGKAVGAHAVETVEIHDTRIKLRCSRVLSMERAQKKEEQREKDINYFRLLLVIFMPVLRLLSTLSRSKVNNFILLYTSFSPIS